MAQLRTTAAASTFFATTPIFYVNSAPHLGHLYTALMTDAQCRFRRLLGAEVFLATGTDEHGQKVERAAAAAGVDPRVYCDSVSSKYRALFSRAGIAFDDFVRTTESRHKQVVTDLWRRIARNGHIRKASHAGWYSVQDETFLTEKQVEKRADGAVISIESGHVVEWTEEQNYVFDIGVFRDAIRTWLDTQDVVRPRIFRNHLNQALSENFNELSVSRPSNRLRWGIPVPDDPDQIIYVWLDALANYLTVAAADSLWPADVHVVGKDILKFHAFYWPAFLLAADLPLPKRILCHSHWMVEGEKMSKSKGNVIDPNDIIDRFSVDGARFALLREGVPHADGNFNTTRLISAVNAELANTLGNLLSRSTSKSINAAEEYVAFPGEEAVAEHVSDIGRSLMAGLDTLPSKVEDCFLEFNYYLGIEKVMEILRQTNLYFQEEKPWELRKTNHARLEVVLHVVLESLRVCGILLQPIVPDATTRLLDKLGVTERMWADSKRTGWTQSKSPAVPLVKGSVLLFEKIKA